MTDKFEHKSEELAGKAKEKFGKATGDEKSEAEGRKEGAVANLKQAGDKVKDAFKR